MKHCTVCKTKLTVIDTRELSENIENERGHPCVKQGQIAGFTDGLVRERKCPSCDRRYFTREMVIHVKEKRPKRFLDTQGNS